MSVNPLPENNVPEKRVPEKLSFGLLPEPEGRTRSFITSSVVNGCILLLALLVGMIVKPKLIEHHIEQTTLLLPETKAPEPVKLKVQTPKIEPPKLPEIKLDAPKISMPKIEPKLEKPIQMEAKLTTPVLKEARPAVILAPQPKAALTAAMPAQDSHVKPSTAPVHLGETFGAKPNPNATRPATIAAIGNPYGGMTGPSVAPHGVVGSTGIGNGLKSGSNAGIVGKVASAGIPGGTGTAAVATQGKVASAAIPKGTAVAAAAPVAVTAPTTTRLEVLSKPAVQYTPEARQMKVQGDVVLRVTFTASGQVQVQGVLGTVQGLHRHPVPVRQPENHPLQCPVTARFTRPTPARRPHRR